MNLQELIAQVEPVNPALAAALRDLAPKEETDLSKLKVQVNFKLEKFEGEAGPDSKPFEVIEGGDSKALTITRFEEPD